MHPIVFTDARSPAMSGVVVERAGSLVAGYGKILGRPGLALVKRELCIMATLVVTGASKQLHSHLNGALNVGALPADVETAPAESERFLDEEARGAAAALWERVQRRYVG